LRLDLTVVLYGDQNVKEFIVGINRKYLDLFFIFACALFITLISRASRSIPCYYLAGVFEAQDGIPFNELSRKLLPKKLLIITNCAIVFKLKISD